MDNNFQAVHESVFTFALLVHLAEEVIKQVKGDEPYDQNKAGTAVFNTVVQSTKGVK